jgi:acyl-CoA hydrolase
MTSPRKTGKRYVRASQVEMTQLVLPNDTNVLGNLLGGRLMEWMDIAAAISAQRHSNRVCVTAAVDNLVFHQPIHLGEVVTLQSAVNRVFGSSMEVGVSVIAENQLTGVRKTANTAYLTFVAISREGTPEKVAAIHPETAVQRRRYREALVRRNLRLKNRTRQGR